MVVVLQERPAIAQIAFDGMKEFEKDQILKALKETGIADGRIFDRSPLKSRTGTETRQYLARGRYAANVTTTVTPSSGIASASISISRKVQGGQDSPDQHCRQQGLQGKDLLWPFELTTPVDDLVQQERPVFPPKLSATWKAQILLHEPGVSGFAVESTRFRFRPTSRTSTSPSTSRGRALPGFLGQTGGDLILERAELRPWSAFVRAMCFREKD